MVWTNKFAYIVGLIASDGNLSKDGRHIEFNSKDLEQVQNFREILKLKNIISIKKSRKERDKNNYYHIQFGNVKLYQYLETIGLHPHKSKTIREVSVPERYFADFLRGVFDGDGHSYSYWDKRYKASFRLYIGFTSASKPFLTWIQKTIFNLYSIKGALKCDRKSYYQLKYAKLSSMKLTKIIYYDEDVVCLNRKKYKIQAALAIIEEQAGVEKLVYSLP